MRRSKKLLALLLTAAMLMLEAVPVGATELESTQTEMSAEDIVITESEAGIEDAAAEASIIDDAIVDVAEDVEEATEDIDAASDATESLEDDDIVEDELSIEEILPCMDEEFCSDSEIRKDKYELSGHLDDLEYLSAGQDYDDDEIVVAADSEEEAEEYAVAFGGTLLSCDYGYALIKLNTNPDLPEVTVEEVVEASSEYTIPLPAAWPNYYRYIYSDTETIYADEVFETGVEALSYRFTDPFLVEDSENYQWQHSMMQSNKAWQAGYTGQGINVAVIDTGVINHEDLDIKEYYEWVGDVVGDSGSIEGPTSPTDVDGHGTHCIGIIGAKAGNGKGGAGIAPDANMYAINVNTPYINDDDKEDYALSSYGIQYAINTAWNVIHADVISMSLGGPGYTEYEEDAINNAYNNGTAVFVASGNNRDNTPTFPAAFKNAICVAAVDQSNTPTDFSCISSKVRYTGPGVEIYSTFNSATNGYTKMNGTSQATPCVAGAAAIFLSSGMITSTGAQRVNDLLALMDKSCVKSGAGKGTPNLAKGLGLSTSTTAPLAPVAKVNGVKLGSTTTFVKDSVTVDVTAEIGADIYYSLNGGSIKVKDGVVSNGTYLGKTSGQITVTNAAVNKLCLVTISNNNALASKEAAYNIKLEPKVSEVEISTQNNIENVAKGGSIQLTGSVVPFYAKEKGVTWQIITPVDGVTISSAGKVSVKSTSTAPVNTRITVRATAKDGSDIYSEKDVFITEPIPIKSVKASSSTVTIYDGDTANIDITTTDKYGTITTFSSIYEWKSSNPAVAGWRFNGSQLEIVGVGPGKTTIIGLDATGQGKKVTINVTVNKKVDGITISGPGQVAQGKKITPVAALSPTNVTDKKLVWSVTSTPGGSTLDACGVSINNSTGAITTKATATCGSYTVQAVANDKKGAVSNTYTFEVIESGKLITKLNTSEAAMRLFRVTNGNGAPTTGSFQILFEKGDYRNLEVVSSAPEMVKVESVSATGLVTVKTTGKATGNAKITVKSTDGSNLKKDVAVSVVNPITKMYLTIPKGRSLYLAYGKTMKLNPVFITESGAIDSKAKSVVWESDNESYITVDKSGTIKSVNRYGKGDCYEIDSEGNAELVAPVTITARTTDGSNLTAKCEIVPVGYVMGMILDPYRTYNAQIATYTYGSGYLYSGFNNMYKVTISGPENGLFGIMKGDMFVIQNAHKSGKYTVKITRNDGSGKSVTRKVNANVY